MNESDRPAQAALATLIAMLFCALCLVPGCGDGSTVIETRGPDGTLQERRTAVPDANGQWLNHGPYTTYYPGGKQKAEEGNYEYGRFHGLIRHWYANGQLKAEGHWNQGRLASPQKVWDEQGNLLTGEAADKAIAPPASPPASAEGAPSRGAAVP